MKKVSSIKKKILAGLGIAALSVGGYYLSQKLFPLKKAKIVPKIKSLTKLAAQSRAQQITSYINYKLLLNLNEGDSYTGIVQQSFELKTPNSKIFLDYNGESISQLLVNHKPLNSTKQFKEYWDGSFISIPCDSLVVGSNTIEIQFKNSYCKDGFGLHSFVDKDQKQYLYSNLAPYWASRIFPCMDQPNLKGKFQLIVINPKSHVCIANEEPKNKESYDRNIVIKEMGEMDLDILQFLKNVNKNSNIWVFLPTKTISSYLFAVISGPFKYIKCQNTYKDIQMTCYCRESLFTEMQSCAEQLFTITIEAMKFYEQLFQYPYPFSKYDSIFCPEFNFGAMENVGAVAFNDGYLFKGDVSLEKISGRASTIVHELAHMWFGNLVTMDWWDDVWLNESFADFVALYCLREISQTFPFKLSNFDVMSNMRKIWGYREDGKISTHPIAAEVNDTDEADSIFDGITYSKGQAVIRQLLNLLGKDNFSRGLSEYFKKYEYKNATCKNFLDSLQKHFKLNEDCNYTLEIWAEEWLKTASYNQVTPVWNSNNFEENAQVEIVQECVQDQYPTLRHHKIQIAFYGQNSQLLQVKSVLIKAEKSTIMNYDGSKQVKAILLNYQDDCFLKVILDPTSLNFFKTNLHNIQEICSRNLIWRALYDMVHDGKLSSAELINLAVEQLPKEQEIVLVTLVFMFCRLAVQMFTPMRAKPLLKQKMFTMILNQLKTQTMDKPTRMSFQDELVTNAVGIEQLNYMEQFLQQSDSKKEIDLTVEQKWVIAQAFARSQEHLRSKKQEILAIVLQQDQSSNGQLHFQTIKAAIYQTEQEKMKTWQQIMDTKSICSLYSSIAIMKGFNLDETWQSSQRFHDLFFKNLIQVFKERQLQFAQNYFTWLFPKSEDFQYLIKNVEDVMSNVPENMQTVRQLLRGMKDEINVKMRAVEAYLKFENSDQK